MPEGREGNGVWCVSLSSLAAVLVLRRLALEIGMLAGALFRRRLDSGLGTRDSRLVPSAGESVIGKRRVYVSPDPSWFSSIGGQQRFDQREEKKRLVKYF